MVQRQITICKKVRERNRKYKIIGREVATVHNITPWDAFNFFLFRLPPSETALLPYKNHVIQNIFTCFRTIISLKRAFDLIICTYIFNRQCSTIIEWMQKVLHFLNWWVGCMDFYDLMPEFTLHWLIKKVLLHNCVEVKFPNDNCNIWVVGRRQVVQYCALHKVII
jgi:hypothetical protein